MKKVILILWLFCLLILSNVTFADANIDDELRKYFSNGESFGYIDQVFLDSKDFNLPFVIAIQVEYHENEELHQLHIFRQEGEILQFLWKSDVFSGTLWNLKFDDLDNNGNTNIICMMWSTEKGNSFIMYDWNDQYTKKLYPLETSDILYGDNIDFNDYDGDGRCDIIIDKWLDKEVQISIYIFENSKFILEKKQNITYEPSSWEPFQETKLSIDPDLENIIMADYKNSIITDVQDINWNNLNAIFVKDQETEEQTVVIVEKVNTSYKILYQIDKMYHNLYFAFCRDLNMDGITELVLTPLSYNDLEYFYIFRVTVNGYRLLSPLDDDGKSLIWVYKDDLEVRDKNGDGIPELVGNAWVDLNDECVRASRLWSWSEDSQCYEVYQTRVWDDLNNKEIVIP